MIAYLDSSALVKLVIDEAGSDDTALLWDAADAVVTSRVANAEVRAAIAAAHRAGRLTEQQLALATDLWREVHQALRLVEITPEVDDHAGELAAGRALSGFDAIHLASTLLLGRDDVIVASWDRRLLTAARTVGLATLPAERA